MITRPDTVPAIANTFRPPPEPTHLPRPTNQLNRTDNWACPPFTRDLVALTRTGSDRPRASRLMLPAVPAVRPGRRVSYNESGCGDTQSPIPTFASSRDLKRPE